MKKFKILVTYVEAGMGHIVSAEAIATSLEKYYPDEVEVIRTNFFREQNDKDMLEHEKFFINSVKASSKNNIVLYAADFFTKLFSPGASLNYMYNTMYKKVKEKGIELIESHNPDMVISTHYTPLHISVCAKERLPNMITACYDPDPNIHSWWDHNSDLFVVNSRLIYDQALKKFKFNKDNLHLGKFISRDEVINCSTDKKLLREKHHLPLDNFTIIMADGAYANAKLKPYANKLLKLDKSKKFTLIIIAGKNEKVYQYFSNKAKELTNIDLRVYRYVDNVYELYSASDIFITKTGPNAILDSVQVLTPIIGTFYASPIERDTKKLFVDDHKVGLYCKTGIQLVKIISQFIDDPSLLQPYVENCKKFKEMHTGGEKIIADKIIEVLRKTIKQVQ